MKLVVMSQVYNQNTVVGRDGMTNIQRFMESVSKYCDGLVIFDDGSTDGTRDVITSFSGDFELEIPSNETNNPEYENYHRERCLAHCRRLNADWVVAVDPDEVFEKRAEKGALRSMLESVPSNIHGVGFYMGELWRTDRYVRVDGDWAHRLEVRAFRLASRINELSNNIEIYDNLSYDIHPAYRTTLTPCGIPAPYSKSSLKIIHYAYVDDVSILHKYNRWKSLGVDLSSELDDSDLRITDANPRWFGPDWPHGPGIESFDMPVNRMLV